MSTSATEIIETVRLSRIFPAPREQVFRAWTTAEEFKQWWRPGGFTTRAVEMDLRIGGKYRIAMQSPDGKIQCLFGTYLEIRPPERLTMTWSLEGSESNDGYEAILTLEFISRGEGTKIALTHEKLPKRSLGLFEAGWKLVLDQLSHHLAIH